MSQCGWCRYDKDGSGSLDFTEFVHMVLNPELFKFRVLTLLGSADTAPLQVFHHIEHNRLSEQVRVRVSK